MTDEKKPSDSSSQGDTPNHAADLTKTDDNKQEAADKRPDHRAINSERKPRVDGGQ
jgi:hypothetical protein